MTPRGSDNVYLETIQQDSHLINRRRMNSNCDDLESLTMSETYDKNSIKERPKRPLLFRLWRFLHTTATEVIKGEKPPLIDLELPQRYRPTTIKGLCEATGFSPVEVKRLYWSFKSECPSGLVNQETFHTIYSKFFPSGANLSCYPNYIFSTLDHRKTGVINFEDFAIGLSILLKGSDEDKLKWIFQVYDVNKDGILSKEEFRDVTASIYELMGSPSGERQRSEAVEQIITSRADQMFQKMDEDQDGVISLDDFIMFHKHDQKMNQSIELLKLIPL